MKYIYTLLFLAGYNFAYGQFIISGKIEKNDRSGLAGATLRLYKNSVVINTILSGEDGSFNFVGVTEGLYKMTSSFTGFQERDTILKITKAIFIELTLFPKYIQLDNVNIKSNKSFMEKKIDRIVYNIDGMSIYANKPISDILNSIQRLNVTKSSIEIKGSGPAVVMIDDRIIYLSNRDLLEYLSIFKDDIASIEIMTNPPAKYDAQGSGLVNIVTKKKKRYGLFGYVESDVTKNTYLENDETLNLSFRNKNFSLITSLGESIGAYQETTNARTNFTAPGITDWADYAKNKNKSHNEHFSIVAELLLSKKTKLYYSYSLSNLNFTDYQHHDLNYTNSGRLDSVGSIKGLSKNKATTNIFNLGLNSIFGKNNNSIDVSLDYVNKGTHMVNNAATMNYLNDLVTPTNTNYALFSLGNIPKNVISSKIDVAFPKFFIQMNLETGIKYTRFDNNSQTDYDEFINGTSIYNGITTKDKFHYNEQDIAGYVSLNKNYKKWNAKVGLRFEETTTNGYSTNQQHQSSFGNFFPSAFLQYKITDGSSADISYTRRIIRPTLFDVNPFRFFSSIYSFYVGNPLLNPSLQNNFNFNLVVKSNYLFSLFYNVTHSPIVSFPFNVEKNKVETRKENNGKLNNYGFNFDMSLNIKSWWQSSFSASIGSYKYYTDFNYNLNGVPVNITLSTRHSFQISPSLSSDVNFSATLPGGGFNISSAKGYSSLDLGFTKTLLRNKLILTLAGQDLLRLSTQTTITRTANFKAVNSNYYDFRQVVFSVKYKFGKELKVVRNKSNPQELNRLR